MTQVTLLLIVLFLTACGDRVTRTSIDTPRGNVTYKEQVVPGNGNFKDGFRDLSPNEMDQLRQSAVRAHAFIARYVPAAQLRSDLLENLDIAFANWLVSENATKPSSSEVESIVGAAFGQYCIERLPVRWALATDARGSEFAIVGENPPSLTYPLAAVRYRVEDRKTDFLGALYETLSHVRKKPT
jgi:hypothetical protein